MATRQKQNGFAHVYNDRINHEFGRMNEPKMALEFSLYFFGALVVVALVISGACAFSEKLPEPIKVPEATKPVIQERPYVPFATYKDPDGVKVITYTVGDDG